MHRVRTLALGAAVVFFGCTDVSTPSTRAPSPDINDATQPGHEETLIRTLQPLLVPEEGPSVKILRADATDDEAFALFVSSQGATDRFGAAWFFLDSDDWSVGEVIVPIPITREKSGSKSMIFKSVAGDSVAGFVGFVDPTASLVAVVTPELEVAYETVPKEGAVVLIAPNSTLWGQIRQYRGISLVTILPLFPVSCPRKDVDHDKARPVASRFIKEMLAGKLKRAERYVHLSVKADSMLKPLRDVFIRGRWQVVRTHSDSALGFLYVFRDKEGQADFFVQMAPEEESWSVCGYSFGR